MPITMIYGVKQRPAKLPVYKGISIKLSELPLRRTRDGGSKPNLMEIARCFLG